MDTKERILTQKLCRRYWDQKLLDHHKMYLFLSSHAECFDARLLSAREWNYAALHVLRMASGKEMSPGGGDTSSWFGYDWSPYNDMIRNTKAGYDFLKGTLSRGGNCGKSYWHFGKYQMNQIRLDHYKLCCKSYTDWIMKQRALLNSSQPLKKKFSWTNWRHKVISQDGLGDPITFEPRTLTCKTKYT
jgi:hypothetical protein